MYKFCVLIIHLSGAYGALFYANIGDNVTLPCVYASESSCRSFLQQPVSDSVQPGDSVTLNCTVHTGTSDREHSVYWFKKDTGNSHLGIMYVHTHSSTQCMKGEQCDNPPILRCMVVAVLSLILNIILISFIYNMAR
ncbi:uncharacterized protein AKAME5_000630100 [Lates japonicus]|uniref:Ig-like domain-containing protein n=1 Tax=Lates japonicus TaxID=270547 RepID=A0AAD3MHD1_LATJO|nr:uncharacterized protein AKAME5_000630100 [Lates japonicus]